MKLNCPNCQGTIEHLKTDVGFLGLCMHCYGHLVTFKNLRAALPPELWKEFSAYFKRTTKGPKRQCPRCRVAMKEFDASTTTTPYLVDLCQTCRLFWFDPGEFEELPTRRQAATMSANATAVESAEARTLPSAAQVQLLLARSKMESVAARAEGNRRFWRKMRRSFSKKIHPDYPHPDLEDLDAGAEVSGDYDFGFDFDFGADL